MRHSQVLVIAAASFLFSSEAIAVTTDSNQAKISTVARSGPSRLLRTYSKPVQEKDSDDSVERGFASEEDDESEEERGFDKLFTAAQIDRLAAKAQKWGYNYDDIAMGYVRLTERKQKKWQSLVNQFIKENKKAKTAEYNEAWRANHGY